SLLPPAILEWKREYPDMACELSSDHSRELVQKLLMREIDLALTLNFSGHPGLTTQVLANGVLVALASKGYWSAAEINRPLPLSELAGAPLIGLSSA
ncbi:substrate-binding domain-containing protein, partial [Acinetobacter beijerinckii]